MLTYQHSDVRRDCYAHFVRKKLDGFRLTWVKPYRDGFFAICSRFCLHSWHLFFRLFPHTSNDKLVPTSTYMILSCKTKIRNLPQNGLVAAFGSIDKFAIHAGNLRKPLLETVSKSSTKPTLTDAGDVKIPDQLLVGENAFFHTDNEVNYA